MPLSEIVIEDVSAGRSSFMLIADGFEGTEEPVNWPEQPVVAVPGAVYVTTRANMSNPTITLRAWEQPVELPQGAVPAPADEDDFDWNATYVLGEVAVELSGSLVVEGMDGGPSETAEPFSLPDAPGGRCVARVLVSFDTGGRPVRDVEDELFDADADLDAPLPVGLENFVIDIWPAQPSASKKVESARFQALVHYAEPGRTPVGVWWLPEPKSRLAHHYAEGEWFSPGATQVLGTEYGGQTFTLAQWNSIARRAVRASDAQSFWAVLDTDDPQGLLAEQRGE